VEQDSIGVVVAGGLLTAAAVRAEGRKIDLGEFDLVDCLLQHGQFIVASIAVLAMDCIDLDSGRTVADLHDIAAAFALSGHRTRSACQLFWNSFWKTCRGRP